MTRRAVFPFYKLPINGEWQEIRDKAIKEMPDAEQTMIDEYIFQYQMNPLSFSLVHGRPRKDGSNDVQAMCNDHTVDLAILTAGNQFGKSAQGCIYTALRALPTDPNWPCFQQHGIDWHEWKGPQEVIVASYAWSTVAVVWDTYRLLLPREELGNYAPRYGSFEGETGRQRNLTFGSGQAKHVELKCGTRITFLCYTQGIGKWSGRQCDIAHLDEQCPELHYEELSERQSTRGDYTPIVMTLTGHVVDERPDTGASGWIKQKIIDEGITKGRKVGQYRIAIEDVPDVFMSAKKKAQKYKQWVEEPEALNDERALRTAEARYWGGWEQGGGVEFGEFNPEIHVIEPFDFAHYKPTYYRMMDHGEAPCAAAMFAMMPWGDMVMVDEYYAYGRTFEENAVGILDELCGNTRRKIDEYEDAGNMWPIYEEVYDGIEPYASEMDIRSFGGKVKMMPGRNVGQLYNQLGLTCTRSTGMHDKLSFPILHAWLGLDKGRRHINEKIGRSHPDNIARFGAPRLYVVNTCVNFISEISRYMGKDKDDHLLSCTKFLVARDRTYQGDYGLQEREPDVKIARCSETGY